MGFDKILYGKIKTDGNTDAYEIKSAIKNLRDRDTLLVAFEDPSGQSGEEGGADGREEHIDF